jgi:hypothetical protein
MRARSIALAALLAPCCAFAQLPSPGLTALAQVPAGSLSGNTYSNDSLGVIFHFPPGWTANLDPGHSVSFGKDPDGPANQCTRILLRYEAPRKVKGWFTAWGILFAVDPNCLGAGPFPTSAESEDGTKINAFAGKIFELYHPAPFFPPGGGDVFAKRAGDQGEGPVVVYLEGHGLRNVDEADPSVKRTPVPVTTLFSLTQAPELWVGWAEMDDEHSKKETEQHARIEVKVK